MTPYDACRIFKLSGLLSQDLLKKTYRKACKSYHPDSGGSENMMKLINNAHDVLKSYFKKDPTKEFDFSSDKQQQDLPSDMNDAFNAIKNLKGITIEIMGIFIWVYGDTKPYRTIFKENGFFWASKKKMWYFKPKNHKSKNRIEKSISEIRDTYGSTVVNPSKQKKVTRISA